MHRKNLSITLLVAALVLMSVPSAFAQEEVAHEDPRVDLTPGWTNAEEAASNMELVINVPRPEGFFNPEDLGDFGFANSDLAFAGDFVIVGSYYGFNIYDISNPDEPVLRSSIECPGGQGDVSVYENLLFVSVEEARGRIDCGTQGVERRADPERFRGVRIFDISDLDRPVQVAAVQTCRGSHTNTLVTDPNDPDNVYVYVSGASYVRPDAELPGCSALPPNEDPATSLFRIEIIQVPLAAPHEARVVNMPRIFADEGRIDGLWRGGDHGDGTQRTAVTNHCHDITAYPELGIAAGACSGNGILLDISNPAHPVRIAEVSDPNFAYWHSATFNNDGTTVIFTDEWGGGMAPRCQADDPRAWGANAIFDVVDGELVHRSYYKLPAPQTATENCVAHNGSLIPVPGRDIKVQAWYQGGVSVFDFTDSSNPFEIAFFDRGPLSETDLVLGGYWSTYWYNGRIYGSEITRGLDVLRLLPSEHLSENEIAAAEAVAFDLLNVQEQPRITWPASFTVARAYVDQLERGGALSTQRIADLRAQLDRAEGADDADRAAVMAELGDLADSLAAGIAPTESEIDASRRAALVETLRELARSAG